MACTEAAGRRTVTRLVRDDRPSPCSVGATSPIVSASGACNTPTVRSCSAIFELFGLAHSLLESMPKTMPPSGGVAASDGKPPKGPTRYSGAAHAACNRGGAEGDNGGFGGGGVGGSAGGMGGEGGGMK